MGVANQVYFILKEKLLLKKKNKKMKTLIITVLLFCFTNVQAQNKPTNLNSKIGLHFLLNDFNTNLFNPAYTMHSGFGVDYYKGLFKKIDAVATLNISSVNYVLPPLSLPYGSNNLLLDVNIGTHIKAFEDSKTVNPFIIAKVGYSKYVNLGGLSLHTGAGVQFNIFNEVYIVSTVEYRKALNNNISNLLHYTIGLSTNLNKAKEPKPKKEKQVTPPKQATKDIAVTVKDEATGLPLQYAEVKISCDDGTVVTAFTNSKGIANFDALKVGNYEVSALLNNVEATKQSLTKNDFKTKNKALPITLTHNDPRFTLVGKTVDKTANRPIEGTAVTITNTTNNTNTIAMSQLPNGEFRTQLAANSEYEIVGKKESYISNIEKISTQGLKRSATLYVELELGIEEAKAGKSIVLNNIYFASGSATVNVNTSSDLKKLIQFLKDNITAKLEIQGHTDNTGNKDLNLKLSQQRADNIIKYLVENGINATQLIAKGYGDSMPVASNTTTEGKSQNRRVEMKVIE
jgi:outer membrane protein OmpA-like peptidoglycan-associated protein